MARLIRAFLCNKAQTSLRIAATQDPTNPTKFAAMQAIYLEYERLSNAEGFAKELLEFYDQQENNGRSRHSDD